MDDPGRVRSQIINVEGQIQRFGFDCILVVSRKVIIRIPPVLGTKPRYMYRGFKRKGACLLGYNIITVPLYRAFVKVLKDALAHLGPYQTLTSVRCIHPGGENTVSFPATIQI